MRLVIKFLYLIETESPKTNDAFPTSLLEILHISAKCDFNVSKLFFIQKGLLNTLRYIIREQSKYI